MPMKIHLVRLTLRSARHIVPPQATACSIVTWVHRGGPPPRHRSPGSGGKVSLPPGRNKGSDPDRLPNLPPGATRQMSDSSLRRRVPLHTKILLGLLVGALAGVA